MRLRALAVALATATVMVAVAAELLSSFSTVGQSLAGPFFGLVGAIIIFRYPRNPVGWIALALGLSWGASTLAPAYGEYALVTHRHSLFGGLIAAAVSNDLYLVNQLLAFWLILCFPTGRVLNRWRVVFWAGTVALTLEGIFTFFSPGPTDVPGISNPVGYVQVPSIVDLVVAFVIFASLAAAAVSALWRLSVSRGVERQQIKLFLYGGTIAMTLNIIAIPNNWSGIVGELATASFVMLPLTIGAAMLRYRLYDIDVLINRTLVYGSVTLSLGAVYIAGVIGLQGLFRALTGQSSELIVAIVTLAIAAVFNPWRRRLQNFVDRRFYRRKYDAQRILSTFSTALHDEIDLDQLGQSMVGVVHETIQPASVALWLRGTSIPPEAPRGA